MSRPASQKFIPDRDSDFANMARIFASEIECEPARFGLSTDDAQIITQAVTTFREVLSVALSKGTRTKFTIMNKDEAREKAVRMIRKYANLIRVNDQIN